MAIHFGVAGVRSLIVGVHLRAIEFPAPLACRLNRLFVRISTANPEGDTIFDINVNGVSVFGDPADRPRILAGTTSAEVFPDIPLLEGDMVTVDVDSAPLGGISGLYIIVQLQDAPTIEQYIKDAYNGCFGRDPDAGELSAAITALGTACAAETTLAATKIFFDDLFLDSEYTALATTDEEYIEDLYNSVLGRPSDFPGYSFWFNQLDTLVLTRQQIRDSFNNSTEHVNLRVLGWCPTTLPRTNAIQIQGSSVPTNYARRTDFVYTTASLAGGADEVGSKAIAKCAVLLEISADIECRVRLYTTAAKRDTDRARLEGADRTANDGLLGEFVFTAGLLSLSTQDPVIILYNLDVPAVTSIYLTGENKSGGADTVSITMKADPIEI